jgi:hypothetical protein
LVTWQPPLPPLGGGLVGGRLDVLLGLAAEAKDQFGEAEHAVFRDGVGPESILWEHGCHRCDIHDVPRLTRFENLGDKGAHAVDDAPQVHIEDSVPFLERQLPGEPAIDHAGIVHGDVQCTEPLDGPVRSRLDSIRVADIDHEGFDLRAC